MNQPKRLFVRPGIISAKEQEDRARLAVAGTIFVLACSQTKNAASRHADTPAESVYTGTGFKIGRRKLDESSAEWMILSGGYGFLQRFTPIRDYERPVPDPRKESQWIEDARVQARLHYPFLWSVPRLVILGSRHYSTAAEAILGGCPLRVVPPETPLVGLSIGYMLRSLTRGEWLVTTREHHDETTH